jgi:hypothetical protein
MEYTNLPKILQKLRKKKGFKVEEKEVKKEGMEVD